MLLDWLLRAHCVVERSADVVRFSTHPRSGVWWSVLGAALIIHNVARGHRSRRRPWIAVLAAGMFICGVSLEERWEWGREHIRHERRVGWGLVTTDKWEVEPRRVEWLEMAPVGRDQALVFKAADASIHAVCVQAESGGLSQIRDELATWVGIKPTGSVIHVPDEQALDL